MFNDSGMRHIFSRLFVKYNNKYVYHSTNSLAKYITRHRKFTKCIRDLIDMGVLEAKSLDVVAPPINKSKSIDDMLFGQVQKTKRKRRVVRVRSDHITFEFRDSEILGEDDNVEKIKITKNANNNLGKLNFDLETIPKIIQYFSSKQSVHLLTILNLIVEYNIKAHFDNYHGPEISVKQLINLSRYLGLRLNNDSLNKKYLDKSGMYHTRYENLSSGPTPQLIVAAKFSSISFKLQTTSTHTIEIEKIDGGHLAL